MRLALRPLGFLGSTTVFLVADRHLGEPQMHVMIPVSLLTAGPSGI